MSTNIHLMHEFLPPINMSLYPVFAGGMSIEISVLSI